MPPVYSLLYMALFFCGKRDVSSVYYRNNNQANLDRVECLDAQTHPAPCNYQKTQWRIKTNIWMTYTCNQPTSYPSTTDIAQHTGLGRIGGYHYQRSDGAKQRELSLAASLLDCEQQVQGRDVLQKPGQAG